MSHVFVNRFLEYTDVLQVDDLKFPSNRTKHDMDCALKCSEGVHKLKWHSYKSKMPWCETNVVLSRYWCLLGSSNNQNCSLWWWMSSIRMTYRCTLPFAWSVRLLSQPLLLAWCSWFRIATFHLSSDRIQLVIPIHNMPVWWLPRGAYFCFRHSKAD